jgi:hypothetical protein
MGSIISFLLSPVPAEFSFIITLEQSIHPVEYQNSFLQHTISDALLLKQTPKKQTRFVSLLNQNKSDLFFVIEN